MKKISTIKKALPVCILFFIITTGTNILAQVGIGTTAPAAALDITSTDAGILIPRVQLESTTILSPLTATTATPSELVYNTATVGDVTPGFYYLNPTATAWIRLASGTDVASNWRLTGNAGTTSANFLGTTDFQSLIIKTNNIERMRVNGAGNIAIGTAGSANITDKLQIQSGNILINPDNSTGNWIRWENNGFGIPTTGARSAGTKLILSSSGSTDDYSIGTGESSIWQSVPTGFVNTSHRFYEGPNLRMIIKGDGNVGIGTDLNPTAKLDVNGNARIRNLMGTGTRMVVANTNGELSTQGVPSGADNLGDHNAITRLNMANNNIINANSIQATSNLSLNPNSGNVGIGTTAAPAAKLDVNGNARISNLVGTGTRMVVANANGELSTQAVPPSGADNLGNHDATIRLNMANNNITNANSIQATSNLSLNPTSGNVGIGTTAPASKFHVQGSGTAQEIAIFGSATDARYITFGNGASGNGGYIQLQTAAGLFNFGLHGIPNQLVLKNNSNVGIGTADAAHKLTVAGGNIGLDNQRILMAKNTSGTYENVLYGRWADNATYLDGGTGGTSLRTNNGTVVNQYLGTNGNTSFGLASNTVPTQRIDVGSGNVRIRDINLPESTSTNGTDRVVVADANGILKTIVPETAIRTVNSVNNLPVTAADETILVNTQPPLGNVLVTLPSPVGLRAKKYIVKKIDASANIVVVSSPNGFDGGGNITITGQQSYMFQSDGNRWYIIARYN